MEKLSITTRINEHIGRLEVFPYIANFVKRVEQILSIGNPKSTQNE